MGTPMGSENGKAALTIAVDNSQLSPASALGLIDLYLEYTKDVVSPVIFRKWAAIHAIGAAVERRVWTRFNINRLHPNMFVFLVGPPGTGKTQALRPIQTILRKADPVTLSPNDVTKQSMLDALKKSPKVFMDENGPTDYHYLDLIVPELSNFMSEYDAALAGVLTDLFDCGPSNEETRRSGNGSGMIVNPGVAMIAGTATKNLGKTVSGDLWGQGFMARVILVHSAEIIRNNPFDVSSFSEDIEKELVLGFERLGEMSGCMTWDVGAQTAMLRWQDSGHAPVPQHNKLAEYNVRRWLHCAKLAMIAALADERMIVYEEDFELAKTWLLEAEAEIPEIFKDMNQHSDGEILEELRSQMLTLYIRDKRAIHASFIYGFLRNRVASHSIDRMITVAEASGMMVRLAGTDGHDAQYIPKAAAQLTPNVL